MGTVDKLRIIYGESLIILKKSKYHGIYLLRGGQTKNHRLAILDTVTMQIINTDYLAYENKGNWVWFNDPYKSNRATLLAYDTIEHRVVGDKFIVRGDSKLNTGLYMCGADNEYVENPKVQYIKIANRDRILTETAEKSTVTIGNKYIAFTEMGDSNSIICNIVNSSRIRMPLAAKVERLEEFTAKRGVLVILRSGNQSYIVYLNDMCNIGDNTVTVPWGKLSTRGLKTSPYQKLITIGEGTEKRAVLADTVRGILLQFEPEATHQILNLNKRDKTGIIQFNKYLKLIVLVGRYIDIVEIFPN